MSATYDLVIRAGTIADGRGGAPFDADIAIDRGHIAAVGKIAAQGREEFDAKGLLVTPGFVDIHTHYDGQVTWENRLIPSSAHGVTTAVMGNCGVGFAPCRPDQHELLIRLMEGVEDIPHPVLVEGLKWNWESFPDYLAVLAGRHYDMDIANYMPHAALRVFVMGKRGVDREPATPADCAQMAALLRDAIKAGAIGFATSRLIFHRSSDGQPIPTYTAGEDELTALAMALKECGQGVMQVVSDFDDPLKNFKLLRRLAEKSGRPLSFSLGTPNDGAGFWRELLAEVRSANEAGLKIKAQIMDRAIGIMLGHELTLTPFTASPSYRALAGRPFAEKLAALRTPDVRARILSELPQPGGPPTSLAAMALNFDYTFELGDPPNYEPDPGMSIAARAARLGRNPADLCYDLLLERNGTNQLYIAFANFQNGSLEAVGEMMRHPDTVLGLADGGAHCGTICDGSYSTFLLSHWTRDRKQGRLSIGEAVKALTSETAATVGLFDRGVIAPGYKADLNIIDHGALRLRPPELVANLPAGGRRLLQRAEGYRATIVSGEITYRDGVATTALPGRLVKGQQARPAS